MKQRASRHDRAWWQKAVEEISSSNDVVPEACSALGVTVAQYYFWRRRFASSPNSTATTSPRFHTPVEVSLFGEIEIKSKSGRSILVRGAVASTHLREVLRIVEDSL